LYANAHRGKVKKTIHQAFPLQTVEEELRPIPSKGWAGDDPQGLRVIDELHPIQQMR